jgi:hypothetical protein
MPADLADATSAAPDELADWYVSEMSLDLSIRHADQPNGTAWRRIDDRGGRHAVGSGTEVLRCLSRQLRWTAALACAPHLSARGRQGK